VEETKLEALTVKTVGNQMATITRPKMMRSTGNTSIALKFLVGVALLVLLLALIPPLLSAKDEKVQDVHRPKTTPQGVEIAPGVVLPWISNGIGSQSLWLERGGTGMDTAFFYGDEAQKAVGEAVKMNRHPRSELFVTTKVMCCPTLRCHNTVCSTGSEISDNPRAQLEHSLNVLDLPQVDLLLLHFPCSSFQDTVTAWRVLEAAQRDGLTRSIGVSNFNATVLQQLVLVANIRPAVNQCAYSVAGHPASHNGDSKFCQEGSALYGSDDATVEMSRALGVTFQAYSPLGTISKVNVMGHALVKEIAQTKNVTTAQIGLRWLMQQGIPSVTASHNPLHMDQSLAAVGLDPHFSLRQEEMKGLTEAT